jgi:hypothetical protein
MAFKFETANERWSWYRGLSPNDNYRLEEFPREEHSPSDANQQDINEMIELFEDGRSPKNVFDYFHHPGSNDEDYETPQPRFDEIQNVYNKWLQSKQV